MRNKVDNTGLEEVYRCSDDIAFKSDASETISKEQASENIQTENQAH